MRWRFWERKKPSPQWKVRSRAHRKSASRLDLTALVPTAADLLAHASASALLIAGEYARAAREAWSATDRDELVRAEASILSRYETLRGLLAEYTPDPIEAMAEPLERQGDALREMTADAWYERVATCYVVGGFLSDFYRIVAGGLPSGIGHTIIQTVDASEPEELVAGVLARIIAVDDAHASRLSLWSRRVVGDTMLIARSVLRGDTDPSRSAELYEPIFTDVLTEHTRRLDALGLTA
ncbi:ferritin-like fold-containing protein [Pontimonas sp.]|uniref:ferritin-like fold-containing protein n=1 Tax=Pontimonas sp. TaxID=2304492 RepID=UPI00286FE293|nr:ferritin-like fold-containing protein [Pontimonas sp.]MDR9396903.1 ferritin-like fold-containing protein [Pontimonas sp.]MDR9434474.1 ferritin-like fold-containing protein [Pontimonas sp.]